MAPHKRAGLLQFLETSGPVPDCVKGVGIPVWIPDVAECDGWASALAFVQGIIDPTNHEWADKAADIAKLRTAAMPIGSLKVPETATSLWVVEQRPQFATIFGMLISIRSVQIGVNAVWLSLSSEEMEAHTFLISGFGRQLLDLDGHIDRVKQCRVFH